MESPAILEELLSLGHETGASDLHLRCDRPAVLRVDRKVAVVEMPAITEEQLHDILKFVEQAQPVAREDHWYQRDFALIHPKWGRYRVNAFIEKNKPALSLRAVKSIIPSLEELNLPTERLTSLTRGLSGLILISGATGSGKSTTLASLLTNLGKQRRAHVITLEDPIEYLLEDNRSMFTQREIGVDTENFVSGLRSALRQDPDVIMIGELRDAETFRIALQAAETGHLVLATTHAASSLQTMERLLEFFPPEQHSAVLRRLADNLRAVIAQKLVPAIKGSVVPAIETLIPGPAVRLWIREANWGKIQGLLEHERSDEGLSFNRDLLRLIREAKISKDTALEHSPNPQALELLLKGISYQ